MRASIYMTLSQKIEKMKIHSVVGEISSYEVDGRKSILSENTENSSTFQTTADCNILKQNILYHSNTFYESTIKGLSIDLYIAISSPQTTAQIEGCKKYLKLQLDWSTLRVHSGKNTECFLKSFWGFKEDTLQFILVEKVLFWSNVASIYFR